MKNRLITFAVFLSLLVVPAAAHAQGKIGLININGAIGTTQEGKKAIADMQKKYQPRQQELQRLQQEMQGIQDQLNRQNPPVSEDEQRRLNRELEDKQKVFKRSSDDAQSDYNADRDEVIRRIGQKMVRIIDEYAQQNNFALILDGATIPVYYAAKDMDVTAEIVKRYDAANPVAEAGTASPAAKPAAAPASKPATPKP